jgi:CRISPR-associated protein Cmr6
MSRLPFPTTTAALLRLQGGTNRSLLWDRGVDVYDSAWKIAEKKKRDEPERGKIDFLKRFHSAFVEPVDFAAFTARRSATLQHDGARQIVLDTCDRLVIGLGLPHPFETGFLFDRLTGCPYLPGSSVKGLVRSAAQLTVLGDLEPCEGSQQFWSEHLDQLLGPRIAGGSGGARGQAAFYDAFPEAWPKLEIDIMTPHYGDYYQEKRLPGDWDDPVPIPFLTVAPGTRFRFWFRLAVACPAEAAEHIEALLSTALDWLGIGAKKAAGYGSFSNGVSHG